MGVFKLKCNYTFIKETNLLIFNNKHKFMSAGHGQIHKKNVYPKSYSSYNLRMEKKTGFYNIFSKTI